MLYISCTVFAGKFVRENKILTIEKTNCTLFDKDCIYPHPGFSLIILQGLKGNRHMTL